jgi:KDEL-tailed cysteine endopeptidase
MKTPQIIATVAIAGAVATFAVLNSESAPAHQNFLATPIEDAEREFINFIATHHRSYGTKEEYNYRLSLFAETYKNILEHNSQKAETLGYTKGINFMSDLTAAEFNMRKGAKVSTDVNMTELPITQTTAANGGFDWRNAGAVGYPKDQGQCGSCWAFSTTGAVEGLYKIKQGILPGLSEQQLVDCSNQNLGCNGGWPERAMQYYLSSGAVQGGDYGYEARQGSCRYDPNRAVLYLHGNGYNAVASNNQNAMVGAVNGQPVSVLIEADQNVFQSYRGGIINDPACGTNLDHAVLLIGYGDGYWILKNSWGTGWGESGFFNIAMGQSWSASGVCGVLASGKVPTW